MALTVKVTNEDFPENHEFSISSLGKFVNGKERELTKEEEQAFVDERGIAVRDALTGETFEVKGTATAKVPETAMDETTTTTTKENKEGGES
jgi:hypothetical protein